jgi:hypothetical protein
MVYAHADVASGVNFGAALTDDDVAGDHVLPAKLLHAEAAAVRIAPVARRTARFLMSHDENSKRFVAEPSFGASIAEKPRLGKI